MTIFGCIADDFTGATDVGAAFVQAGYRTKIVIDPTLPYASEDTDAYVVALKSRTAPAEEAIASSLAALRSLVAAGADRFYVKYCSTFDSTPRGNIGPVIDAILDELDLELALVVPSFPANGRTVYQGHLFVFDQLLSESPMRNHPLTPMTDSRIATLLKPQTSNAICTVDLSTVRGPENQLRDALTTSRDAPTLAIVDAIDDDDLGRIAALASPRTLLTGGAGLAAQLPRGAQCADAGTITVAQGHRLIVSGSASQMTREQVGAARAVIPALKLDIAALLSDTDQAVQDALDWSLTHWNSEPSRPVLVFATGSEDDLGMTSDNREEAASAFERALARLTARAVAAGAAQIIVAGGETSGAVVSELGVTELIIGPPIAPGVVWTQASTSDGTVVNLALKSGNFGEPDLFTTGWDRLT